ncbi:MAG: hypothetical protein PGN26_02060 [Xylophilus ampelinus]
MSHPGAPRVSDSQVMNTGTAKTAATARGSQRRPRRACQPARCWQNMMQEPAQPP